jgi:hypothetical protein
MFAACTPFFHHAPQRTTTQFKVVCLKIVRGQMLVFDGALVHAGAGGTGRHDLARMHLYATSATEDSPSKDTYPIHVLGSDAFALFPTDF